MARSPTYAKHAGRDVERDDDTLDLFATAEPVKLKRRKACAKPRRAEPSVLPEEARVSWIELAISAVRRNLLLVPSKGKGSTFTMEEMRARLDGILWEPEDLRTWAR